MLALWQTMNIRSDSPPVAERLSFGPAGPVPAPTTADGLVDVHSALAKVRLMPEFQPPSPDWLEQWGKLPFVQALSQRVEAVLQRLMEMLAQWLSRIALPEVAAQVPIHIREVFQALLAFLTFVAILYAIYFALGLLLRGYDGWSRRRRRTDRAADPLSSSVALAQAGYWAERGRYDEGIRQLYLAALSLLDERRLVPFEESRSNREYRLLLARTPRSDRRESVLSVAEPFARLAEAFEAVRYGRRPGALSSFWHCEETYRELRDSIE